MSKYFSLPIAGGNRAVFFPNQCPLCHHTITIAQATHHKILGDRLQAIYECPNDECQCYFIAYYEPHDNNEMKIVNTKPANVKIPDFPSVIYEISPMFVSIYKEAVAAKELGYKQIAGPGYRKAFEFLIKDYAIGRAPDEQTKDQIKKSFSGKVIEQYVADKRIQAVAKRALWLGNDETHYLRDWGDQNIDDLVTLIKLTVDWIEIERASENYSELMPDKK